MILRHVAAPAREKLFRTAASIEVSGWIGEALVVTMIVSESLVFVIADSLEVLSRKRSCCRLNSTTEVHSCYG